MADFDSDISHLENDLAEEAGTQFYTSAGIAALEETVKDYVPLDVRLDSIMHNLSAVQPFHFIVTKYDTVVSNDSFQTVDELISATEDAFSERLEQGILINLYVDGRHDSFGTQEDSQRLVTRLSEQFHDTPTALGHIYFESPEAIGSALEVNFLHQPNSRAHSHIDEYMQVIMNPYHQPGPLHQQELPKVTNCVIELMRNEIDRGKMTLEHAKDYLRMVHGVDKLEHPGFLFAKDGIVLSHFVAGGHAHNKIFMTADFFQTIDDLVATQVKNTHANQIIFYHNHPYMPSNPSEEDIAAVKYFVEHFSRIESLQGVEFHNWIVGPFQPTTTFEPYTLGKSEEYE